MWSPFPYNIQWADAVFLVLFVYCLGSGCLGQTRLLLLDYLVLAYLAASAVSLINVHDSGRQGVELLKLVYVGLIYLVIGTLCDERPMLESAARWTAWVAVVVAGSGALYLLGGLLWSLPDKPFGVRMHTPYVGDVLRLQGTFPGPELLGNFLTAGLPFALALTVISRDRSHLWLGTGVLALLAAELFTFSHSWVGLATAGLLFIWPLFKGRTWRIARAVLSAGVVGLFAAMLFVSTFYVSELTIDLKQGSPPTALVPVHAQVSQDQWRTIDISATYTLLSYHLLKALAWETFRAHPLTGVGRGNFDSVSTQAAAEGRLVDNFEGIHPHMTILGQFAESGLVGGIALLALWTGAFMTARRLLHAKESDAHVWIARASLAALAGLFINGLYTDVMNFRFLWVVLAFLRGLSSNSRRPHTS
jgi:O-antigen ligase